jgi:hypothetical protein
MYITGEELNYLCDLSIYERYYLDVHSNIKNYCKKIIYVNENNYDLENIINKTNTFFTKMDWIDYFINNIMPLIKRPFILVTHNSDYMSGERNRILINPLLIKWYGQNMNVISDKTEGIPIGFENKMWNRTNFEIIDKYKTNIKQNLLYLNFSLHTNQNRNYVLHNLLLQNFEKNNNKPWNEYIEELSQYKFAISPEGNGIDCHRTWECLYLGVIPIVLKHTCMNHFNELPILFVDDYNCISVDFLLEKYDEFKNKQFNLEKMDINYWKEKFTIKKIEM